MSLAASCLEDNLRQLGRPTEFAGMIVSMRPRAMVVALALELAGCGRTGFDIAAPADGDALDDGANSDDAWNVDAAVLVPCFTDNFDDGDASDWMVTEGSFSVSAGAGPDGSPAYSASAPMRGVITHAMGFGVTVARVAVDFRIGAAANGDFVVVFAQPGWTLPDVGQNSYYYAGLYPPTSDSAPDEIIKYVAGTVTTLTTNASSVASNTWHHVDVYYRADASIRVDLDQVPHMTSPPDTQLAAPLDLFLYFYGPGAMDNLQLDCIR